MRLFWVLGLVLALAACQSEATPKYKTWRVKPVIPPMLEPTPSIIAPEPEWPKEVPPIVVVPEKEPKVVIIPVPVPKPSASKQRSKAKPKYSPKPTADECNQLKFGLTFGEERVRAGFKARGFDDEFFNAVKKACNV